MSDVITIRKLGDALFETAPPLASISHRLPEKLGGDLFRRRLWPSFDHAAGAAVAAAIHCGWAVQDATGRLTAEQLAGLVEATRREMKP